MMEFKCEDVLKNVASSIYYFVFNYKTMELEEFKLLKYGGYTGWRETDFDAAFVSQNMFEEDKVKNALELRNLALSDEKYTELVHRFYSKDKKIVFIKAKVTVLKKDDERIYCIGIDENVSKEKEYQLIFERLKESDTIGIVIFREKVIYANDYVQKTLGITKEELTTSSLKKFIVNVSSKELDGLIERRKKGESLFVKREKMEVRVKNKRFYVNAYTNTVIFEGEYAGLAILIDVSNIVKREIFSKITNKISKQILNFSSRRTFFEKLIKIIRCNNYEVYLKYRNYEYGEKIPHEPKGNRILIKGNYLYLPFSEGFLLIKSEFENEFDSSIKDEYFKLKSVIDYAINNIKQLMLLNILKESIEKSYQWVLITDKNGTILYANDMVEKLSGYSRDDIIGQTPNIFKSNYHDESFYEELWDSLKKRKIFENVFIEKRLDGKFFYLKLKIIPVEVDDEVFYVSLGIDITKEKELEDSLVTDDLTGLFNRKGFILKANEILEKENDFALLLIDIRNFKALNQVKGNFYGDLILKEFAQFLRTFFYEEDLIGRIGGDEFAVLVKLNEISNLAGLIHKLISKINNLKNLSVNIGIALYPKDAEDINLLIEKASVALSYAQNESENSVEYYSEQIKEEIEKLLNAKNLIYEALEKNLFEYFFQPYYDINSGKIVGFEALLRIVRSDRTISPDEFIDYAEKSGIIKKIEKHMYKKIDFYYDKLRLPLSINFSARSFKDENHIREFFDKASLPLTVELTEREITDDIEYTKKIFDILKSKNLKIAIDDFGTGYSTFSYVRELDFDVLKIDMSFIKNIEKSKKDYALVKTIILLAKELNLKTIAEGVETEGQLKILRELGCDVAQGFLIAKPMPLDEAVEFLKNFNGINI
jgi:diguanylate cyclase (GGDEF)-like protein/PAS domain S-box-containing protein